MNKSKTKKSHTHSKQVNWHVAISSAVKINLKDYEKYLEYHDEYYLIPSKKNRKGQNTDKRIDLLVIKLLLNICIPINFARIFRKLNVFEIKGKGDTLNTDAYYKGISYVGQLISEFGYKNQYTRKDVTLTFITMSYPRNLMKHLNNLNKTDANCRITIENNADGIYNINGETFVTQIIVASRLSPEENKFLRCICDGTSNPQLFKEVADDCETNLDDLTYKKYLQQLIPANEREDDFMCEALFELFGTSSEEIAANAAKSATKEANERIQVLTNENQTLSKEKQTLSKENQTLSKEKQTLSKENQTLSKEKQTLSKENQALSHTASMLRNLLVQNGIPIPE